MIVQQPFRLEPGLLYVDESGQLHPPRKEGEKEFGVVAGVLAPDSKEQLDALRSLVRELRRRLFGDPEALQDLNGEFLGVEEYDLIAREVRERWVLGYPTLEITNEVVDDFRATFDSFFSGPEDLLRRNLGPTDRRDLRLNFLERQYREAIQKHPTYMALLFKFYRDSARWFRKNGILPRLKVWLDDKIPRGDKELVDFFGRFAFYTEFPEIYSKRLGEVVGLDASPDFNCWVSSDREIDGLVIADAIAYAAGVVARGADVDGVYKRALDRMNCDLPWDG